MYVTKRQTKIKRWFTEFAKRPDVAAWLESCGEAKIGNSTWENLAVYPEIPLGTKYKVAKLTLKKLQNGVPCEGWELNKLEFVMEQIEPEPEPQICETIDDIESLVNECVSRGLMKGEIAELIGVHQVSLSRWLSGLHAPSRKHIDKLKMLVEELEQREKDNG